MATAGSAALLQGLNSPHGQYGGAPSVASAGGGANKKQYFYLSDLNKPVQIKMYEHRRRDGAAERLHWGCPMGREPEARCSSDSSLYALVLLLYF